MLILPTNQNIGLSGRYRILSIFFVMHSSVLKNAGTIAMFYIQAIVKKEYRGTKFRREYIRSWSYMLVEQDQEAKKYFYCMQKAKQENTFHFYLALKIAQCKLKLGICMQEDNNKTTISYVGSMALYTYLSYRKCCSVWIGKHINRKMSEDNLLYQTLRIIQMDRYIIYTEHSKAAQLDELSIN